MLSTESRMRGDMQVRFGGRYGKTYCRKAVRRSVPSLRLGKGAVSLNWLHTCMLPTMYLTCWSGLRNRHRMYTRYLSLFGKQDSFGPSFQQLEIVPLSSPALLSYLQGRGINLELAKENVVKPVTPTTASVTLPSHSLTVRVGLRFVTPISRAASPPRKSPTSDSREKQGLPAMCSRVSWTTFPF